jgi:hypothetical protein
MRARNKCTPLLEVRYPFLDEGVFVAARAATTADRVTPPIRLRDRGHARFNLSSKSSILLGFSARAATTL